MEKACSALELIGYKGRRLNLYLIFHYYNCTATTLSGHFRNIEVEWNDGSHLLVLKVRRGMRLY